jgi:hypothetical protein
MFLFLVVLGMQGGKIDDIGEEDKIKEQQDESIKDSSLKITKKQTIFIIIILSIILSTIIIINVWENTINRSYELELVNESVEERAIIDFTIKTPDLSQSGNVRLGLRDSFMMSDERNDTLIYNHTIRDQTGRAVYTQAFIFETSSVYVESQEEYVDIKLPDGKYTLETECNYDRIYNVEVTYYKEKGNMYDVGFYGLFSIPILLLILTLSILHFKKIRK